MRNAISSLFCVILVGPAIPRAEEKGVFKSPTADQAKQLAQDKSGRLILDHLTALSPEAAKELTRHEGWLSLNGLTSLSSTRVSCISTG